MGKGIVFVIAGFILFGMLAIVPNASADGYSEGAYPNRTFFVTRSGPGGPRADTFIVPILPGGPAFWSVTAEIIAGSAVVVELFRDDGGILTFEGSWKLRQAGQSSPPVLLLGGLSYVAHLTPFGRPGTSVLQEHAVITHLFACFTFSPETAFMGQPVTFDASCSTNAAGEIAAYIWDFGDETTAEGVLVTHAYSVTGTYLVTLTVADLVGFADSTSQSITVTTIPHPVASFTVERVLMTVTADGSASSSPGGGIVEYRWDWGDGSTGVGVVASHAYSVPGKYVIVLTVMDTFGASASASQMVTVNTSTIDFEFYDFFNVSYADFWDLRTAFGFYVYPVNAECFNATSVAMALCTPTDPDVADVETHPFTNWQSAVAPGRPGFEPSLHAPYRMRATGTNALGYNLSEPVFLPVSDYDAPPGGRLDFDWHVQYMNQTRGNELGVVCRTNWVFGNDGYISESRIRLTLDLQESKRLFGVTASNPSEAAAWWSSQTTPDCTADGPSERALEAWFVGMGGTQFVVGKYDIINGFEWYYQPFATNINATVDPTTGVTTLDILHIAYGTEVLLARVFYWGNASYAENYLDSTRARGWLGMETPGFEDLLFRGTLDTVGLDFTLTTVVPSHFQQLCAPGPNGLFDRIDDVPVWRWGPVLADSANDFFLAHPGSELDRYPGLSYVHCTPGAPADTYGADLPYDYLPIAWDLDAGETWRFLFPRDAAVFYDPNATPTGANPRAGEFVELVSPLALDTTLPVDHGAWDIQNRIWTVLGPALTGGPVGSPGGDGQPGTLDDEYPLEPWGAILLGRDPGGQGASIDRMSPSFRALPVRIREADVTRRR